MADVTYFNYAPNELNYKVTGEPYYQSTYGNFTTFSSKLAGDTSPTEPITLYFDPPIGIFSTLVYIPQLRKQRLGDGFTATAYDINGIEVVKTSLANLPNDKQLYEVNSVPQNVGYDFAVPYSKEIRRVLIVRDPNSGSNRIRKIVFTPEKDSDDYIYYRIDRIFQNKITAPPAPDGTVVFSPDIRNIQFEYTRGSNVTPPPIQITATNASSRQGFSVVLKTNSEIVITPSGFTLTPSQSATFTINVLESLYQKLGDGVSDLDLNVQLIPV
jgi:hypothetical protein